MPVYEYECPDCGFEFEKQQKFTDTPVKQCPNCGRRKVYRVVSKVAVTFKGSGFYITDSKSSDAAKHTAKRAKPEEASPTTSGVTDTTAAEKSGDTKADATESTESKAEAKPEAKPDKSEAAAKKKSKADK